MRSKDKCPRNTKCEPISNLVSDSSFVCIGYHNEEKEYQKDKFRHCFKSAAGTDSIFDYDEYDIKSVLCVFGNALIVDELSEPV